MDSRQNECETLLSISGTTQRSSPRNFLVASRDVSPTSRGRVHRHNQFVSKRDSHPVDTSPYTSSFQPGKGVNSAHTRQNILPLRAHWTATHIPNRRSVVIAMPLTS